MTLCVIKVMLNDFGSMTECEKATYFNGALEHAPADVVEAWANEKQYVPLPKHDLHMLVATAFHSTMPCVYQALHHLPRLPHKRVPYLQRFWEQPRKGRLFQLADACDYAGLRAAFQSDHLNCNVVEAEEVLAEFGPEERADEKGLSEVARDGVGSPLTAIPEMGHHQEEEKKFLVGGYDGNSGALLAKAVGGLHLEAPKATAAAFV